MLYMNVIKMFYNVYLILLPSSGIYFYTFRYTNTELYVASCHPWCGIVKSGAFGKSVIATRFAIMISLATESMLAT